MNEDLNDIQPNSPYWTWGATNALIGKPDYTCVQRVVDAHNAIVMELEEAVENATLQREKLSAGVSGIMQENQAMKDDLQLAEEMLGVEAKEGDRLYDENQKLREQLDNATTNCMTLSKMLWERNR